MTKEFADLPNEFEVYRGAEQGEFEGKYGIGLSWTLDEDIAIWFSKRFNKDGRVMKRRIRKSDVIHFTNRRGEKEIVVAIDD